MMRDDAKPGRRFERGKKRAADAAAAAAAKAEEARAAIAKAEGRTDG